MSEAVVATTIPRGILKVEDDGTVWRLGQERARPSTGGRVFIPCAPVRAERWSGADGYGQVRVAIDGRRYNAGAHRLVWHVLRGPIPDGMTVNHINGLKQDNRPENLELATPSEQAIHAHATGLRNQLGERNPAAKLTDDEVLAMRHIRATTDLTQAEVAEIFGVSHQHVSAIERGVRRAA